MSLAPVADGESPSYRLAPTQRAVGTNRPKTGSSSPTRVPSRRPSPPRRSPRPDRLSPPPAPAPTTHAVSRSGTINAHDGRTRIAAPWTPPSRSPTATRSPRRRLVAPPPEHGQAPEPGEHQRDEQPFREDQLSQPDPVGLDRREQGRHDRQIPPRQGPVDEPREEEDPERPQRRLDEPDGQEPLAEEGLARREKQRIAGRPQGVVGHARLVDDIGQSRADRPGEGPVDRGVVEEAGLPQAVGIALHDEGGDHAQGQRRDEDCREPGGRSSVTRGRSPRARPSVRWVRTGSGRPAEVTARVGPGWYAGPPDRSMRAARRCGMAEGEVRNAQAGKRTPN